MLQDKLIKADLLLLLLFVALVTIISFRINAEETGYLSPDSTHYIIQAKYVLFAFFLLSLLLNLPKKFILQQLQQIV